MKEIIKSIIKDFHESPLQELIERKLSVPLNSKKIITVIGSRRSGKTYFLYQLMKELPKSVRREDIIYINFEDERLNLVASDLQLILESYYELYPYNKNPLYFFFDELQNIENWEKFVRRIYDTVSRNIFITGSSSKLLSKEIATSLRGRSISYELFPLTFDEYLKFKNIRADDLYSTKNKARIVNAFNDYLSEGGFPEVVNYDRELRSKTMQSYLDVMIYRDIIERYDIKNASALRYFIVKSLSNVSNYFSVNKLFNELKSAGIKISKDSTYEFINYVNDCYLVFLINKYSESISIQNANDKKLYCIDNGIVNSVSFKFSGNKGRMLENAVYLHLKAAEETVYYYKGKGECDFIIHTDTKVNTAIQVTTELNDVNKKRETEGLLEAMRYFKLNEGFILTIDETDEIIIDNKKINVMPAWRWMMVN
ncbi:MAG: ATP-binding protein [Ignavibacteriaceae bacterium]